MTWQAIPLRAAILISTESMHSDHGAVVFAAGRVQLWERAAAAVGYRLDVAVQPVGASWAGGELIRLSRMHRRGAFPRPARSHLARVAMVDGFPTFTVLTGPARNLRVTVTMASTGAGTLVTVEAGNPRRGGALPGRIRGAVQSRHRAQVLWALRMIIGLIELEQHMNRVVVAAAVIRDGAVLAARRTYPAEVAGRWEFPGGKVGLAETDQQALRRELVEELGIDGAVGERVGPDISLEVETVLRLYVVAAPSGGLHPREHDEVRWLSAAELDDVDWLDADRALLAAVRPLL